MLTHFAARLEAPLTGRLCPGACWAGGKDQWGHAGADEDWATAKHLLQLFLLLVYFLVTMPTCESLYLRCGGRHVVLISS